MKVLLLSAYDAMSHQYWRKGLVDYLADVEWTVQSLPPRHFSWRVRGNPLFWSQCEELNRAFDLVIATSMVDFATLKGLVPALANTPSVLYFHENQFAYPPSSKQHQSIEPQMVSIYSALASDVVLFNSQYNQNTFFGGLRSLLKQFPDYVPGNIVDKLLAKSQVLPVPLYSYGPTTASASQQFHGEAKGAERLHILWNHRWEYDKGADRLLRAVELLNPDLPLTFHIVGQRFRQVPQAFDSLHRSLSQKGMLGTWGFLEDRVQYEALLATCDIALSTALHDFQGIAVMEAVQRACVPLVPNRLAYRELFAEKYRYGSDVDDPGAESAALAATLSGLSRESLAILEAPSTKEWEWPHLGPKYRQLIEGLVKRAV